MRSEDFNHSMSEDGAQPLTAKEIKEKLLSSN